MGEDYYPDPDWDSDWEPDEDYLANDAIDSYTQHVERTLAELGAHPRAPEIADLLHDAQDHLDRANATFVDGIGSAYTLARHLLDEAEQLLLRAGGRIDERRPPSPWYRGFVDYTKLIPPCPCGGEFGWVEDLDGVRLLYCTECGRPVPGVPEPLSAGFLDTIGQAPLVELPGEQARFDDLIEDTDQALPLPSKKSRKGIPKRLRADLLMRSGFRCEWCDAPNTAGLQIGHILSVRDGHTLGVPPELLNSSDNLIVQCGDCNQGLGGESMPTWIVAKILMARAKKRRPPAG